MHKTYRRSLGGIRSNPRHHNNSKSPEGLGRILLERTLIQDLYDALQDTNASKIEASLASWSNRKKLSSGAIDRFLTIEIRALSDTDQRWYQPNDDHDRHSLEDFFREDTQGDTNE